MFDDVNWAKARLRYDQVNGSFTWIGGKKGVADGQFAGTFSDEGYLIIRCEGRRFRAHRLAWLMVHGEWPKSRLDHKNGLKWDNRIANLRECTASENKQNETAPRSDNALGMRGVSALPGGKYRAIISAGGANKHIGVFDTPDEAHRAYRSAKRELHPFWSGA